MGDKKKMAIATLVSRISYLKAFAPFALFAVNNLLVGRR
jgi:hypothetical protein